jgi:pimeloyl-ACP methyl ester carboxylesterase
MRRTNATITILLVVALAVAVSGCGGKEEKRTKKKTFYDTAELQKIRVEDIDVAYKVFGPGEPLVMITGYSTTMDTWDPRFLEDLASKYKVVVFDNRGMGETTSGTKEWTIDQFAADTAGFIRALKYSSANVLGWSLGGDVALGLVVFYPERVRKLISYAGDCGGPQKIPAPEYKDTLKDLQDVNAPLSKALAALYPPEYMKENPDYWKSFPFPSEMTPPEEISRQNQAYEEWPGVYDELPDISRPVLVATGTEDVSTPPGNADILVSRIPHSKLVTFPGAGHGLQYQYPDEFAQAIMEFLGPGGD